MARKRASMREGPLAELFRATEAAQRAKTDDDPQPVAPKTDESRADEPATARPSEPQLPLETPQTDSTTELEATVEHVYDFEVGRRGRRESSSSSSEPVSPVAAEAPTEIVAQPRSRAVEQTHPPSRRPPRRRQLKRRQLNLCPSRRSSRTRHPRAAS